MTRRLTVAIVGMVAGALLLAGVGTLVLTQLGARQEARRDLEQQAVDVATSFQGARRPAVTQALRRALRLQGAEVVLFGASGNRVTALPAGVSDSDLDLAALRAGSVISGAHRDLVFAAARVPSARPGAGIVVLTQVVQQAFPFVMLFSAMYTFSRLTRSQELVVARAVGVSVWQFLTPAVLVALVGTRPAGSVSVTVTVPAVGARPTLLTTIV